MATTIGMTVNYDNDDDDDGDDDEDDDNNNCFASAVPELRARQTGDRIPVGERHVSFLQNAQTGSGAH